MAGERHIDVVSLCSLVLLYNMAALSRDVNILHVIFLFLDGLILDTYEVCYFSFSNRLGSLLDQLEKAWPFSRDGQPDEKEMDHIRYVTGKLQQLLSSQGLWTSFPRCWKA